MAKHTFENPIDGLETSAHVDDSTAQRNVEEEILDEGVVSEQAIQSNGDWLCHNYVRLQDYSEYIHSCISFGIRFLCQRFACKPCHLCSSNGHDVILKLVYSVREETPEIAQAPYLNATVRLEPTVDSDEVRR